MTASVKDGYNITHVNSDIQKMIKKEKLIPSGVKVDYGGENEEIMRSMKPVSYTHLIDKWDGNPYNRVELIFQYKSIQYMRPWRNRQTRTFEGRVGDRTGSSPVGRTILKCWNRLTPAFFYNVRHIF